MKKFFFNKITNSTGKENASGFTLIEIVVSSSIFVIVMLIIVGALISLNSESRKARSARLVTDNLSAAIDSMSRNIRMGSYYHCGCGAPVTDPLDCPMTDAQGNGGATCFAFESQTGDPYTSSDQYVYRLNNHRIQRSRDGGASYIDLTAPEVSINDLRFLVQGTTPDYHQPLVTVIIRGTASITPKIKTDFNIQTSLGSRAPNYSVPVTP